MISSGSLGSKAANIVRIIHAIKEELRCGICYSTLSCPIVTPCNHLYCKDCFLKFVKQFKDPQCPICKQKVSRRNSPECDGYSVLIQHYLQLARNFQHDQSNFGMLKADQFMESQALCAGVPSPVRKYSKPDFAIPVLPPRKRRATVEGKSDVKKARVTANEVPTPEMELFSAHERDQVQHTKLIAPRRSQTATAHRPSEEKETQTEKATHEEKEVQAEELHPATLLGLVAKARGQSAENAEASEMDIIALLFPDVVDFLTRNREEVLVLMGERQKVSPLPPQKDTSPQRATDDTDIEDGCYAASRVADEFMSEGSADAERGEEEELPPSGDKENEEVVVDSDDECPPTPPPIEMQAAMADQPPHKSPSPRGARVADEGRQVDSFNESIIFETIPPEYEPFKQDLPKKALCAGTKLVVSVTGVTTRESEELLAEFRVLFPRVDYSVAAEGATHLVVLDSTSTRLVPGSSVQLAAAHAAHCMVVCREWMADCVSGNWIIDPSTYGVAAARPGQTSAWEMAKNQPQLLKGLNFFLPPIFSDSKLLSRNRLSSLIEVAGGVVVDKPWKLPRNSRAGEGPPPEMHSTLSFCLFAPASHELDAAKRYERDTGAPVLTADWLVDSLCLYSLLITDVLKYRLALH